MKKVLIVLAIIAVILGLLFLINNLVHRNDCCSCCKEGQEVCITMCCPCEGFIFRKKN